MSFAEIEINLDEPVPAAPVDQEELEEAFRSAYEASLAAYDLGVRMSASLYSSNPFEDPMLQNAWEEGWRSERQARRRREEQQRLEMRKKQKPEINWFRDGF